MVTEGLPVKCTSCDDDSVSDLMGAFASAASSVTSNPSASPSTNSAAMAEIVGDALRKVSLGQADNRNQTPISTETDADDGPAESTTNTSTPRARLDRTSAQRRNSRTSVSPKDPAQHNWPQSKSRTSQSARLDAPTSNFRKTYDESVTKRAIPCDNCAMTLPRRKMSINSACTSVNTPNNNANGGTDSRSSTLRTRVPCARVYDERSSNLSLRLFHPPSSASSSTSSDTESDDRLPAHLYRNHHRRTGTMTSVETSGSSTSSSASHIMSSHNHYLDYSSTHEPLSANAYCIIRASCLRTLTLETLPRSSAAGGGLHVTSSQPTTPSPLAASSYFTSSPHSAAGASMAATAAANGGSLFFGDPEAGYTTAHVFRVADRHARGHKRVYALIALNSHHERTAMKAFGYVSAAFNDLATWIQQLADAEAERVALQNESTGIASPSGDGSPSTSTYPGFGFERPPHVSLPPIQPSSAANNSGSSFLVAAGNGLSRRMGPGFVGFGGLGSSAGASLRARGLPEILGMPDFFIELHARFVRLLLELGVTLNK
ncbi:hypothetical protein SEPCBS57363_004768 [Sporothrix epigloea]|uniref:UDENN FLCN/SMCR8-type domain-containing protein n=1 Tax=Sporothrix epigloea TaxID=1892477 RepID=A0ABP0DW08_9PEZI